MFIKVLKEKTTIESIDHKFLVSGHTHMECDVDHATIEKEKKRTTMKINHPYDWVQLIRSCRKTNPFTVHIMETDNFFYFAALLKGPLVQKKVSESGERFLWKNIQWLHYDQEHDGLIQYKETLRNEESFTTINFQRRGRKSTNLKVEKLHSRPVPINEKKKKNLLELLHLVDKEFHPFYQNLKVSDVPDTDPDLLEVDPDKQD
uniref:Uncharacterized protein LOC114347702 n=1 Tax=Diabrotica virgifera virgifera TaxID=50390 RepID=A0A6P7HEI9_DIAVI